MVLHTVNKELEAKKDKAVEGDELTTVYHMAYEPSYGSLDIHFYTRCNLNCQACYAKYELDDFNLLDSPVAGIAKKKKASPPKNFLTIKEVKEYLKDISIRYAIFIGTEPSLDPMMPKVAKIMKEDFSAYNLLLTNGVKLANMDYIDEVILSVKALDDGIHKQYTGRSNKEVLANLKTIHRMGKKLQVETVLIPGFIDEHQVEKLAEFVAAIDPKMPFRIDAYFHVPDCPWEDASNESVERATKLAKKHLSKVNCLTLDMKRIGDKAVRIV